METPRSNGSGTSQEQALEFSRRVFPSQTCHWNKTKLEIGNVPGAASKTYAEHQIRNMLLQDIKNLKDGECTIKVDPNWKDHDLSRDANDSRSNDATVYTAAIRILHVAGQTANCFDNTGGFLRAKYMQENAHTLRRQPYYLQRTYPWLKRIFDPVILRRINEWCDWLDSLARSVKQCLRDLWNPSEKLVNKFQLGARYDALWRALDFSDKSQDQIAKEFACYNAYLVFQQEPVFLKSILTAVTDQHAKQYPAISKLSVDIIGSIAKKNLTEAGLMITEDSQDAERYFC